MSFLCVGRERWEFVLRVSILILAGLTTTSELLVGGTKLSRNIVSLDDYELAAEKTLSRDVYNWIAQGNWNEVTRLWNRAAFDRIQLWPRYLRDVSRVETAKEVLGELVDYPLGVSPTSFHRAYNPEGELATARACEELGNVYIMSYFSSSRISDIARVAPHRCRKWVQVYFKPNRTNNIRVIREAERSGFEAVVITIDSTNYGRPYRELRNGYVIQNIAPPANAPISETFEPFVDPTFTWEDVRWVMKLTSLPVIIRGVMNPLDAAEAIRHGVAGIFVSNHGARQLDTLPATIEVLPDIMDVVRASRDRKIDVYFDSGIRTGLDALKAFAYGVNMVFLGRPVLFSLAVNGTSGVVRMFDSLMLELTNAMQLVGQPVLDQLDTSILERPTLAQAIEILNTPLGPYTGGSPNNNNNNHGQSPNLISSYRTSRRDQDARPRSGRPSDRTQSGGRGGREAADGRGSSMAREQAMRRLNMNAENSERSSSREGSRRSNNKNHVGISMAGNPYEALDYGPLLSGPVYQQPKSPSKKSYADFPPHPIKLRPDSFTHY